MTFHPRMCQADFPEKSQQLPLPQKLPRRLPQPQVFLAMPDATTEKWHDTPEVQGIKRTDQGRIGDKGIQAVDPASRPDDTRHFA